MTLGHQSFLPDQFASTPSRCCCEGGYCLPRIVCRQGTFMQENYLNHKPSMAQNENQMMQIIAKCADAFSAGDTVNKRVRMKQQWSLMPAASVLSTVYPAAYIRYVLHCSQHN